MAVVGSSTGVPLPEADSAPSKASKPRPSRRFSMVRDTSQWGDESVRPPIVARGFGGAMLVVSRQDVPRGTLAQAKAMLPVTQRAIAGGDVPRGTLGGTNRTGLAQGSATALDATE